MEQLDFLEQELNMMLENIKRIREYQKAEDNIKWRPCSSRVIGELKHRAVSLKQRLTLVSKLTTNNLFEK